LFGLSFFFSSRRRHTRFSRDWSSDVCSSDLGTATVPHLRDFAMVCPQCDYAQYPRITPCVIMLVRRGEQALLARSARFRTPMYRSEERRVGKECRDRWWREHYEEAREAGAVS